MIYVDNTPDSKIVDAEIHEVELCKLILLENHEERRFEY